MTPQRYVNVSGVYYQKDNAFELTPLPLQPCNQHTADHSMLCRCVCRALYSTYRYGNRFRKFVVKVGFCGLCTLPEAGTKDTEAAKKIAFVDYFSMGSDTADHFSAA